MAIYKRDEVMLTDKRNLWLAHEGRANGYFNYGITGLRGTTYERAVWLKSSGIALHDYYDVGIIVFFVHDGDAVRFQLAWC